MIVTLANKKINPDEYFEYSNFNTHEQIIVSYQKEKNKYYTLMIIDENAVAPYYIHELIINTSTIIKDYVSPEPPKGSGNHNYHILLFEQDKYIDMFPQPDSISRAFFNLDSFISYYHLHLIDNLTFTVNRS